MTLNHLQKPVVITLTVAAFVAFAMAIMTRSTEAAPIIRPYSVVPGYTVPGYNAGIKTPFLFTPGYRPMPMPYNQIFRYIR